MTVQTRAARQPSLLLPQANIHVAGVSRLRVLDGVRGLAALTVVLSHGNYYVGIREGVPTAVVEGLGYASGVAVVTFFVLSGFCIHQRYAYIRAKTDGTDGGFGLRDFIVRRARRIYPPLALAVLVTVVLYLLGTHLSPDLYPPFGPKEASTVVGALLLQNGLLWPNINTNGALWTLPYEFWFYSLYPAHWYIWRRFGPRAALIAALMVSAAGYLSFHLPLGFFLLPVLTLWAVWCIGAALADGSAGVLTLPRNRLVIFAAVIAFAVWFAHKRSTVLTYATALAAFVVLRSLLESNHVLPGRVSQWLERLSPLGLFSFSLYVVHGPWMAFLSSEWRYLPAGLPVPFLGYLASIATSIGFAYVAYLMVERRFTRRRPSVDSPRTIARQQAVLTGPQ